MQTFETGDSYNPDSSSDPVSESSSFLKISSICCVRSMSRGVFLSSSAPRRFGETRIGESRVCELRASESPAGKSRKESHGRASGNELGVADDHHMLHEKLRMPLCFLQKLHLKLDDLGKIYRQRG